MNDYVQFEQKGQVALLKLNRPEKLNALSYELIDQLMEILTDIEIDPSLRVVILTGTGSDAFSAGADIHQFTRSVKEGVDCSVREFVQRGQALTARLESFPKPIIVAVNGIAFGGGCEITEAAHLAISSDKAVFAKPEINIGIPPTFGGTQRLPRLSGRKRALELLLTGDRFTPQRAYEMGLVNRVVPHDELLTSAFGLAERIMQHSSLSAARILYAVTRGINTSIAEGLLIEQEQFVRMAATKDVVEGLESWIERRKPVYPGC